MRKRSLYLFDIFPKKIMIQYFLGLSLLMLTCSLVVIIGISQVGGFSYAITTSQPQSGPGSTNYRMVTEQNAKTIYNSRVPTTIADALNVIDNLSGYQSAYPITVTPVVVDGMAVVVRGMPNNILSSYYVGTGKAVNQSADIVLIGSTVEARLGIRSGESLSIESSFTSAPINITSSGFFKTGTENDYEILVSLPLGEEIAGLPYGIANAIMVPGSIALNPSTFATNYELSVNYSGTTGNLLFVDSSGYVHASTPILSSSNFTHQVVNEILPYGLYNIVLQNNQLRMTLASFVMRMNYALSVSSLLSVENSFLSVRAINSSTPPPELLDSLNHTIVPENFDQHTQTWIYQVSSGIYTLITSVGANRIPIFGNETFDLRTPVLNSVLNVSLISLGIEPLLYSIIVKDDQSAQIVFSSSSSSSNLGIPVEFNHSYSVALFTSNSLLVQQNVSITMNNTSLVLNVPYIPQQLQNVPIADYSSLGIGFPSKDASFDYFFGMITTSIVALFSTIIILLVLTLFGLDSSLLGSLEKELRAISCIFPKKKAIFFRINGPLFMVSIASALIGVLGSFVLFQLFQLNYKLTFVGYGIQIFPAVYVLPLVLFFSILSWIRTSRALNAKVFTLWRNA